MVNYGFVIDNRTCIGCHACTVACKAEHDIPIGVNRTHVKYIEKGTYPDSTREFSVHRCNHCEDAPCTTICPTTALYTRSDGIVDFDDERCIGCKSCMQACPYDALYINPDKGTAAKCNYCAHRLEHSFEPACVIVCPTESIISGDLHDPDSKIAKMVEKHDTSVRKPGANTIPNVYYIDASEEMLEPSASALTGSGMWTEQAGGVGHFAKYAEKRLDDADTPSMIVQLALEMKAKDAAPRDQAIIRDVAAKLDENFKAKRSYDQPSKGILWDQEVAAYIVTKAMASGFYILCMLTLLLEFESVATPDISSVAIFGLALLAITGLLLVKDLDRPERFLYVLLRPNWDSWLVRGAYVLAAFGTILVCHLAVELLSLSDDFHKWLALGGIPLAWMTGSYTGWLLKQAKGRVIWANKSNVSIALTGSMEMIVFGGLMLAGVNVYLLVSATYTIMFVSLVVTCLLYWLGFIHIRTGLREAQMEPLL